MSTDLTWQTDSSSFDATYELGVSLGKKLKGGEVILLKSDLGGGKTTFAKGLAKGLGSDDLVTSPTFTVSQVYKGNDLTIYHFDFYRLNEGGMVSHELEEVIDDPKAVILVEWGNIIEKVLPERKTTVEFARVKEDENHRQITITYPDELAYLLEGLV